MNRYVVALDAGTGSGRAIVYNLAGEICGKAQQEWVHPPVPGVPGSLDFDAVRNGDLMDRVMAGAIKAANIDAGSVIAVAATSMREGMVLYDESGKELWACPNVDSRARAEAALLRDQGLADRIFDIGGDWVSITAPARFMWLNRNRPDIMQRTRRIGLISDWLVTRLTGEYATEPSAGSSTALFDLSTRNWSDELIASLGLDRAIFPTVVESGTAVGKVTNSAAARTGLKVGTPVVAGGGDTQLALLGLGRKPGDATLIGGSFWQMTVIADRPLIDPKRGPRTLCHARPGEWMVEGIGFLSGFSLRWLRDAFVEPLLRVAGGQIAGSDIFAFMEDAADASPPGAAGVLATMASPMQSDRWVQPAPSLLGFDFNRPEIGTGAAIRAVMEAAAFVTHIHLNSLSRLSGLEFSRLQFTGGSSQGRVWRQIVADVLGLPIDIPVVKETTALGCAMLAASGAGAFDSVEEAVEAMASPIELTVEPRPEVSVLYPRVEARWSTACETIEKLADIGVVEPHWRPAGAREMPA